MGRLCPTLLSLHRYITYEQRHSRTTTWCISVVTRLPTEGLQTFWSFVYRIGYSCGVGWEVGSNPTRQACNFVFPAISQKVTGEARPRPGKFRLSERDVQKLSETGKIKSKDQSKLRAKTAVQVSFIEKVFHWRWRVKGHKAGQTRPKAIKS